MLTIIIVTRSARIIKGKGVNYFRLFLLISENNQDMDIKNTSQILAQNLKELRKNKGISTEKLSQKIKELYGISISADSLANYEVDDQYHTKYLKNMGMRVEYLQCLSDFYGVTVDYLLGNTNDPSPKPCAVDDLGLSPDAITAIMKYGKHVNRLQPEIQNTRRRIFSSLVSMSRFWFLLDEIRIISGIPSIPDTMEEMDDYLDTLQFDFALYKKYGGKYHIIDSNSYKEYLSQSMSRGLMKLIEDVIEKEETEGENGEYHTD